MLTPKIRLPSMEVKLSRPDKLVSVSLPIIERSPPIEVKLFNPDKLLRNGFPATKGHPSQST